MLNRPLDSSAQALQFAINLGVTLDSLFAAKSKYRGELSPEIYLIVLLYHLLQTLHSLWHSVLPQQNDPRLKICLDGMQYLLVHGIVLDNSKQFEIDDAAVRLRDVAIPALQNIIKETDANIIVEKTISLIEELHLENLTLFTNQTKTDFSKQYCIQQIKLAKEAIAMMIKNFSADVLRDDPDQAAAVRLLVVRIGAFWHFYCSANKEQAYEVKELADISVMRLNQCRGLYNKICQDIHEQTYHSYIDIKQDNLEELFNLAKSIITGKERSPRVAFLESPQQPPSPTENLSTPLSHSGHMLWLMTHRRFDEAKRMGVNDSPEIFDRKSTPEISRK